MANLSANGTSFGFVTYLGGGKEKLLEINRRRQRRFDFRR